MPDAVAATPMVGRTRANVMNGAPDVRYSGGFWLGKPCYDPSLFPTGAGEDGKEVAERLGLNSAGFITRDGVGETEDISTEKILDWNLDVIDVITTDYGKQLTVTFAESLNAHVLKFLFGEDKVTVNEETGEVYLRKTADDRPNAAVMFDTKGKRGAKGRGFVAECQVTNIGEIKRVKDALITYTATIDVFNDVTGTYVHDWFLPPQDAPVDPVEEPAG